MTQKPHFTAPLPVVYCGGSTFSTLTWNETLVCFSGQTYNTMSQTTKYKVSSLNYKVTQIPTNI